MAEGDLTIRKVSLLDAWLHTVYICRWVNDYMLFFLLQTVVKVLLEKRKDKLVYQNK